MPVVNIPNPCPLKLNQLSPVEGGFYCGQCSKVVIDFREKSNDEILTVLESADQKRVCGIYNPEQVNRPNAPSFDILKFVASLVLVFGMSLFISCGEDKTDREVMGEVCVPPDSMQNHRPHDSVMGDSIAVSANVQWQADSTRTADSVFKANQ